MHYIKAVWEYPREEPDFWTYPATAYLVDQIAASGLEYPVSGDLTTDALRHVDLGIPAPHFRNETQQRKDQHA
jgi:hypothetical protein